MTLLNTKEVAERLGVSTVRVRQMIRAGKIEAQNLGRDYAISEEALASVVVYRKPGRPPLTDEEKAARAEKRATEKGAQPLLFEPPVTTAKPKAKARAKKVGAKKVAKKDSKRAKRD